MFNALGMNVNELTFERQCDGRSAQLSETGNGIVSLGATGYKCGIETRKDFSTNYVVRNTRSPSVIWMSWRGVSDFSSSVTDDISFNVENSCDAIVKIKMQVDGSTVFNKRITLHPGSSGSKILSFNGNGNLKAVQIDFF